LDYATLSPCALMKKEVVMILNSFYLNGEGEEERRT
jgi:hypothetical protein